MFVRKKRNKSGSVSVQIVDKSDGYRVVETIGSSKEQDKIEFFFRKARHAIRTCSGRQSELFSFQTPEEAVVRRFLGELSNKQVRKVKTVDYLYRYQGITVEVNGIDRFLDKLNDTYKDAVERMAFEYSRGVLGHISVVFYDMTTLYFEAEDEDDRRKVGFSKDGKFQHPQIMLGLLVGEKGYPIGYDIFKGNVFEGHTLLPTLDKIRQKYGLGHPVVVAD